MSRIFKVTKPKKVFTFIDNNLLFYKFKKNFLIQNLFYSIGHRTHIEIFFVIKKKQKFKFKCDKIFVANLGFGKTIKKFIKCKVIFDFLKIIL